MIKGFNHVGIATRDLSRLVAFYSDLFHGTPIREFSWDRTDTALSARLGLETSAGRLVFLAFPGAGIEIFQFDHPNLAAAPDLRCVAKPGLSHICFEVDDCLEKYDRLRDAGMVFHASPLTMPAGGGFAYGRDPDGNVVEVFQPPPC